MKLPAVSWILLGAADCVRSRGLRVKVPLGGNASVWCPYEKGSASSPVYFSRSRAGHLVTLVKLDRRGMRSEDDRFSLEHDAEKRKFKVSFRNLSVEDAGQYWCGVDRWGLDHLTEVNVDVVRDAEAESHPSGPEHATKLYSTATPTATTPTQAQGHDPSPAVSDQYVYLGLAAAVVLCLITSAVFIMIKKKKEASRARAITRSRCYPESERVSEQDNDEYEELSMNTTSINSAQNPDVLANSAPLPSRSPLAYQTHAPDSPCTSEPALYSSISPKRRNGGTSASPTQPASINRFSFHRVPTSPGSAPEESCDVYATIQRS